MEEKSNLSQRTAEIIRMQIMQEHKYTDGQKLPNENVLSEELGVSRTTLREAIRILVSEGILVVQRGRGTFVANKLERMTGDRVAIHKFSDKKVTLRDLYETRMIFEPEAAALACRRADDGEIAHILELGEVCQDFILRNPAGKDRINSEIDFHCAIVKASHNVFISQFMPMITQTIEQTFALDYNLDVIAENAYKDHIMIMNFLEKRDSQALKSAVTIHLHHAFWTEELEWQEEG